MNKLIFLVAVLIATCLSLKGQHDYKSGYIVNNLNDTIYGEIDLKSNINNAEQCLFRKGDIVTKYKPFEIYCYRIYGEKYYVSKEIEIEGRTRNFFLEFLVEGITNLYYLRLSSFDYFFLEKEGRIVMLDNSESTTVKDGATYMKNSERYKGVMKYFSKDAPDMSDKINNADFTYKPLIRITKEYHNAVCNEYDCIDYTKTTESSFYIEPYAGVGIESLRFGGSSQRLSGLSPHMGVNIILKPLRAHNVWNFQVGVGVEKSSYNGVITDYTQIHNDSLDANVNYSSVLIPIKFRYELPGEKFQPYITGGLLNKIIVASDSKIYQHLHTFYKPKELEINLKTFNHVLTVGAGVKYNSTSNRYWCFDVSYNKLRMFATNIVIEHPTITNVMFTVSYGFMK